nr:hypothetical protein [Enterobacter cloacae]
MNLSIIARVLRQLAIIFVLSVLLVAGYIYYAGKQHQQAAINFWGEQYQPDAISTQIDWGLSVIGLFLAGANYFSGHC